jgi:nucleoporin NUP159
VLSPLSQLRNSVKEASGDETFFQPQRTLSFPSSEPNIITFACNETKFIVGFKSGQIVAYDTASIFSQGSNEITPSNILQKSSSPPTGIQANPSNDPALADYIAVVRKDGAVELLNTKLELLGAWGPGDASSTPVFGTWLFSVVFLDNNASSSGLVAKGKTTCDWVSPGGYNDICFNQ